MGLRLTPTLSQIGLTYRDRRRERTPLLPPREERAGERRTILLTVIVANQHGIAPHPNPLSDRNKVQRQAAGTHSSPPAEGGEGWGEEDHFAHGYRCQSAWDCASPQPSL